MLVDLSPQFLSKAQLLPFKGFLIIPSPAPKHKENVNSTKYNSAGDIEKNNI